jgi:hypothetical protein
VKQVYFPHIKGKGGDEEGGGKEETSSLVSSFLSRRQDGTKGASAERYRSRGRNGNTLAYLSPLSTRLPLLFTYVWWLPVPTCIWRRRRRRRKRANLVKPQAGTGRKEEKRVGGGERARGN